MPSFVSKSQLLRKKYEERKNDTVSALPLPASDVCNSCWYRDVCLLRTMLHDAPKSCCVYEFFVDKGNDKSSIEDLVKFTCDTRCVSRQNWTADPCPHDENYCENFCPVSRCIQELGPARKDDLPVDGY